MAIAPYLLPVIVGVVATAVIVYVGYVAYQQVLEARSKNPPAKRVKSSSKKAAKEKAKKAGKGKKPIHHPDGEHGPHYHPDVPMSKD